MKLREFIKAPAITCALTTTLSEAAHLMHLNEVGSLVVLDDTQAIVGILTDRDMALKGFGRALPASTAVEELMTHNPRTIGLDADTDEAATKMMQYGVRRLPVVDADGTLCGVLAFDDLVVFVEREADTLRRAVLGQTRSDSASWAGGWD